MPVVIVESPAKARTIERYLGPGHRVLASFGHIRDLPEKNGSVDPDHDFSMRWMIQAKAKERVKAIADALKSDPELVLATDPDREGEAISWHVQEVLSRRRGVRIEGQPKRVVFNAVTKSAVLDAMQNPRTVDMRLVDAYLARRALDYLVGYNLSPVLWKKLPGARSAGRVQSVCVRLIVEREAEIEAFKAREFWSIIARVETEKGEAYFARLSILDGRKLGEHDIATGDEADAAMGKVLNSRFRLDSQDSKIRTRNPLAPFVTATLQQDASSRLKSNPRKTMGTAQKLYEAGLITYMRTDGIEMAPEALAAVRREIKGRFGADYLPGKPRHFKNKARNAQEAHECIRPTNLSLDVSGLKIGDPDQRQLYDLIWKRTIASQMNPSRFLQTNCNLLSEDGQTGLRAVGNVMQFDGYRKLYQESGQAPAGAKSRPGSPAGGSEEEGQDGKNAELPVMSEGDRMDVRTAQPKQHFTKPPPRFTEASLVKKMVELGIGRPSTYSSIVATIQDRGYVRQEKGSLHPQGIGRMLNSFLVTYFGRYVGYEFTAGLEQELDDVSAGRKDRLDVLDRFWRDFTAAIDDTSDLRIGAVLDQLTDILVPQLFPDAVAEGDARVCPHCGIGRIRLRTGRKSGAFLGCSNYPECQFVRSIDGGSDVAPGDVPARRELGTDPETGLDVTARVGRFGPYLQLGEAKGAKDKPKRSSIPKGIDEAAITLDMALALLALPRKVGDHPEDGEPVEVGISRFGPFVRHDSKYATLNDPNELFTLGMNRAIELLASSKRGGRGRKTQREIVALGDHPDEGGAIRVLDGRYGPYIKWNRVNASIPSGVDPSTLSLDQAVELIAAKRNSRS